MSRYYKPTKEDLEGDLLIEIFSTENQYKEKAYWKPILLNKLSMSVLSEALKKGDIRVKYLDSYDFNSLGYTVKKTFLGTQTQIVDILPDNTEITEETEVFEEDILVILKKGVPQGKFMPWLAEKNVEYKGKYHTVKNLTELRKILK